MLAFSVLLCVTTSRATKQSSKTKPWSVHEHFAFLNSVAFDDMLCNVVANAFDDRAQEALRLTADCMACPRSANAAGLHYFIPG